MIIIIIILKKHMPAAKYAQVTQENIEIANDKRNKLN